MGWQAEYPVSEEHRWVGWGWGGVGGEDGKGQKEEGERGWIGKKERQREIALEGEKERFPLEKDSKVGVGVGGVGGGCGAQRPIEERRCGWGVGGRRGWGGGGGQVAAH